MGSITGEIFETSGKIARRKLPDGRTETGKEIHSEVEEKEEEKEEPQIIAHDVQIEVEEEEEDLEWEPATIQMDDMPSMPTGQIDISQSPKPPPKTEKQPPKSTPKDIDKIQDLFFGLSCALDSKNYSGEEKSQIVAKLFADTTDVRVETMQYVMSGTTYGLMAGVVALLVIFKGQGGGVLESYRKTVGAFQKKETKETDELWQGK